MLTTMQRNNGNMK